MATSKTTAPSVQSMVRNDDEQQEQEQEQEQQQQHGKNNNNLVVVIETLGEEHFHRAREIENEFTGSTGKGFCFGICPFSWCPSSETEFESVYRKHPDRCSTYGVAVRTSDRLVVGVVALRQGGQASTLEESMVHKPDKDEFYVGHIAVTNDARGLGTGEKLLNWAEKTALERGATRLTLGVVKGNPAKSLYDRFGFVDVGSECCVSSCLVGRPHGRFGVTTMEKTLI